LANNREIKPRKILETFGVKDLKTHPNFQGRITNISSKFEEETVKEQL